MLLRMWIAAVHFHHLIVLEPKQRHDYLTMKVRIKRQKIPAINVKLVFVFIGHCIIKNRRKVRTNKTTSHSSQFSLNYARTRAADSLGMALIPPSPYCIFYGHQGAPHTKFTKSSN